MVSGLSWGVTIGHKLTEGIVTWEVLTVCAHSLQYCGALRNRSSLLCVGSHHLHSKGGFVGVFRSIVLGARPSVCILVLVDVPLNVWIHVPTHLSRLNFI